MNGWDTAMQLSRSECGTREIGFLCGAAGMSRRQGTGRDGRRGAVVSFSIGCDGT